ncbi:MAG: hypothetical protein IIB53_12115 [Planctomycetes bacterium]|nr:hypothetical protein [Planctomycetota bacterium]
MIKNNIDQAVEDSRPWLRWCAALTKPIHPMVVRVSAAIMLGAATTVAVAWLMALYVDGGQATSARWSRGFKTDGASQVVPTPPLHPQQNGIHLVQVTRIRRWGTDIVEVWPVWSQNPNYPISPPGSTHALVEGTSFEAEMKDKFDRNEAPCAWWRADGWPLPALSAEARWQSYDALGMSPVIGGVLVGPKNVVPRDGVRILPLQPVWSGLIINTVFYVSLWFALFSLRKIWDFRNIRSRLRRRRGQCVRCGYQLLPDQTRCSECGERVS